MKVKFLLVLGLSVMLFAVLPDVSFAKVELPSWGTGNAESQASSIGKNVADFLALVVGILAIIAILAGAGYFPFNRDRAWQLLGGGVIALVVAGMAFGIARIVAG